MGRATLAAILIAITAAGPGTQPAATAWGLAGSPPLRAGIITHSPELRAPKVSPPTATIGAASVYTETDEQLHMARWALDAMDASELELPAVTIYLHEDRIGCSNDPERLLLGYHALVDGQHIIHSCGNAWTLLHELGHVWDDYKLDDETRQLILEHQGLDEWHAGQWYKSGGEHLASIIAWGLEGTRPSRIGSYDDDHLSEAYRIATGSLPPATAGGSERRASDLTDEQDDLIDHAVNLFEAADLELPGIDLVGFDNRDDCFGRAGAAISDGLRTEVRLCLTGIGPTDDWVALHELAHAWDHGKLDEATRQEFLELRGLTAWRDGEWHDRGAEHAAEILVWGLIDRPVVPGRIPDNSCDELLEAYRTLTGRDPLHGFTDRCEA